MIAALIVLRVLVILCAFCASGCASLMMQEKVYTCTWLEVSSPLDVQTAGPRQTGLRNANCGSLSDFKLVRNEYSVEFWNGVGYTSSLFVRASSPDGRRLQIESPEFLTLSADAYQTAALPMRRAADYTGRLKVLVPLEIPVDRTYPLTITIRVLDLSGAEIGVETITVVEHRGTFTEIDAV